MNRPYKHIALPLLLMFVCSLSIGQQLSVNTKKIEGLIGQWNAVHNTHDLENLSNIYDNEVLFYSVQVPRSKVSLMKKLLFVRNPEYKQRISSDIKYTFHENGIVKCDFTKQVLGRDGWDASPGYLLVGYRNRGYWIIGESDPQTDNQYGFRLKLGAPLDVEIFTANVSENRNLLSSGSTKAMISVSDLTDTDASPINIPLALIFILASAGGLIIYFSPKLTSKMSKAAAPQSEDVLTYDEDEPVYEIKRPDGSLPDQPYHLIENTLKQGAFKAYLLRFFNPLIFEPNEVGTLAAPENASTVLQFNLRGGNEPAEICVYYRYLEDSTENIQLSRSQLQACVSQKPDAEWYVVIGLAGPPDFPDELYALPASAVSTDVLSRGALKPFQKTDSFYYDFLAKRLK